MPRVRCRVAQARGGEVARPSTRSTKPTKVPATSSLGSREKSCRRKQRGDGCATWVLRAGATRWRADTALSASLSGGYGSEAVAESSERNPYGDLEWRDEVRTGASSSRSLIIGPGAGHVVQALALEDVVVVDTSKTGALRLPFPEADTVGNEVGVRIWKGDFLETPSYFAPFDQIIMCSCFEGREWRSSAFEEDKKSEFAAETGSGGKIDEAFVDKWLCKCADLLRPGGIIVFQELQLADNSKAEKTFGEIESLALRKHQLVPVRLGTACALCLRLPLGYLFEQSPLRLKSKVVHGFQRGSKQLGFPTANLHVPTIVDQIEGLRKGVYFGYAKVNYKDKKRGGALGKTPQKVVVNVGERPSFEDGTDLTIEAHVIDCETDDFYGEEMRVVLLGFVRPEMKFDGIGALIARIKRDVGITTSQLKGEFESFAVDAFVNGRNPSYSQKAFEVNAKWTTSVKVMGWTLFRIVSHRGKSGEERQVELMAVCDKEKRCWVDQRTLKKDPNWQPGWFDP